MEHLRAVSRLVGWPVLPLSQLSIFDQLVSKLQNNSHGLFVSDGPCLTLHQQGKELESFRDTATPFRSRIDGRTAELRDKMMLIAYEGRPKFNEKQAEADRVRVWAATLTSNGSEISEVPDGRKKTMMAW